MEAVGAVPPRHASAVPFVALDRQHARLSTQLQAAFTRLLGSSAFTLGTEVEQFEDEFAAYCGVNHCVGVASGTAALSLLLRAHGIGPGDEVVVPAHTFIASALAVVHVGATPVLCDVDDETGLIDPDAARAALGQRSAAILAVHLYGQACDMTALAAITESRGLLLLEDAAQAHGARYCGRRAGSLGDGAGFSFYPSKNLGALGDGGAVCTNDELLAARIRRLRNLGQRAKGEHVDTGYNERLDGLQAAMLRVKLPHLEAENEARRSLAERYASLLSGRVRLVEQRDECESVHHLFPIRVDSRDAIATRLGGEGVQTGIHYAPAIHCHPAWTATDLRYGELPVAEAWAEEVLSLPMHPDLSLDEIDYVSETVRTAVSASHGLMGGNRGARADDVG